MAVPEAAMHIGGTKRPASSGALLDVLDPATNRPIARVPAGTLEDVDAAVAAARTAF